MNVQRDKFRGSYPILAFFFLRVTQNFLLSGFERLSEISSCPWKKIVNCPSSNKNCGLIPLIEFQPMKIEARIAKGKKI